MLENDTASIRNDIGLAHGDKIHVDDKDNGENSVLAKLFEQVWSGFEQLSVLMNHVLNLLICATVDQFWCCSSESVSRTAARGPARR